MEKKKGCFTYIGIAVVAIIVIGAIAGVRNEELLAPQKKNREE